MVTFETKCWENDWKLMLRTNHLKEMIQNCNYPFQKRVLYINNVRDPEKVKHYADSAVRNQIIDQYYMVDEHIADVLAALHMEPSSFGKGYYYSIAELVGIYLCETPYLLHFSSDACLRERFPFDWITEAIRIMEKDPQISIANPTWSYEFNAAQNDAVRENDDWYIGRGFSDQCYLIRKAEFCSDIYNCTHPYSERFPTYGGNSFEKRIDSYLLVHDKYRMTSKHVSYVHQNITKSQIFREQVKKLFTE